ncbi:MAG TPA: hypothetical protein PKA95_11840 [Thermomicrobiales bacterium]|nr:hypothetical protein [Thermomicrobiales bacterium]
MAELDLPVGPGVLRMVLEAGALEVLDGVTTLVERLRDGVAEDRQAALRLPPVAERRAQRVAGRDEVVATEDGAQNGPERRFVLAPGGQVIAEPAAEDTIRGIVERRVILEAGALEILRDDRPTVL